MISWALRPELKAAVVELCTADEGLWKDALTPPEWQELADINRFLKPFYDATKGTESSLDSIDLALPCMDFLNDAP